MGCLLVAHHCFPVKGVTLQWQARARRPSSSEDAGLGLELILTSGSCSSRKQNQILTRKTHLPLPHCHPELRLGRHGRELAFVQLLSETLLLTSESAHLTPLPDSGYLFWQVSPKQSPLTQILGVYSSLDMEGAFLLGLSSVEHSVLFLAPAMPWRRPCSFTLE